MWRIHFTPDDLARTHVTGPHALWEVVLSLHKLVGPEARDGRGVFDPWRKQARERIRAAGIGRLVRDLLNVLAPPGSYFPDFLTPSAGALGLDAGIDAVLSTPRERLRTDLSRLGFTCTPPAWVGALAAGDRQALDAVGTAMRSYFRTAIEPEWTSIELAIGADRAVRAQADRRGGIEHVLSSLRPGLLWEPPILLRESRRDVDLHLNGRGLVLIPSFFCWRGPVKLYEPSLPPVVVYPIRRQPTGPRRPHGLERLLGTTRSRILHAASESRTTGEIAALLGTSASTVSEHANVLREAGLIGSSRHANTVVHFLTRLGSALLDAPDDGLSAYAE